MVAAEATTGVRTEEQWRAILRLLPGYDCFRFPADSGLWFDREAAERAVQFFGHPEVGCLRHIEGAMAGELFKLEPWQEAIVGAIFGWKRADGTRRYREVMIYVPRKNGKAVSLDTRLPTPSGWTDMGSTAVGDMLIGETGIPTRIVATSDVHMPERAYRVSFSNGESVEASGSHLWTTTARDDWDGVPRTRTTDELYKTQRYGERSDRNHSLPMPLPMQAQPVHLPIEPYVLGAWLGDGDSDSARITCGESDLEAVGAALAIDGFSISAKRMRHGAYRCRLISTRPDLFGGRMQIRKQDSSNLNTRLRRLGVLGNKHIPPAYLRAGLMQRLALLQGLMDTDGCCDKLGRACEFSTILPALRDGFSELLASMGLKFSVKEKPLVCNGRPLDGVSYRIQFTAFKDEVPVFRFKRKLDRLRNRSDMNMEPRSRTVQIVDVSPIEPKQMKCVTVDSPSGQFLFGRTMLPTHNSPMCAGIASFMLFCDPEAGQQNYIAASEREQASMLFRFLRGMVEREPVLKSRSRVYGGNAAAGQSKSIVREDTGSFVRVLSREADSVHGGNSHLIIVDELHTQPDRKMVDVLQTSQASANRKNPLFITITTADFYRESICNEKYDRACKVRDGVIEDTAFLPVIYEALETDDWTCEATWEKANPNIDISVSREYLRRECKRAQETPSYEATFKRLHLNLRTNAETVWLPADSWNRCSGLGTLTPKQWREYTLSSLDMAECFGALDLSMSKDITALVLAFHREPDSILLMPWFWVPTEGLEERSHKDHVNYSAWVAQGFIQTTPGSVVDYSFIRERVNQLARQYFLKRLGIDPYNAMQLAIDLEKADGLPVEFYRQGFLSMNMPSKELERRVMSGTIIHGGNPVLNWMCDNTMVQLDAAGNYKPDKRKSTGRIDGIVASIMAIGMYMADGPQSIYESAGALSL